MTRLGVLVIGGLLIGESVRLYGGEITGGLVAFALIVAVRAFYAKGKP